ncbi:MAG TPA: hypothetical protein VKY15_02850 [Acidimicrobiales bacterium]|nr:hypothetical protein [Acidimicrobiales bacterium]
MHSLTAPTWPRPHGSCARPARLPALVGLALALALGPALAACGSSGTGSAGAQPLRSPPGPLTVSGPGDNWGVGVPGAPACNPLGGQSCMLPFPSDYYSVPDPSTPSGRRIDFPPPAMPANTSGTHIDPTAWNANDGFSPGSVVEVQVPGLDLARSGMADQYHVGDSLGPGAPVVLLDATTGRRLAWWAEADLRDPDPSSRLLLVHPAANLPEGHRIVVALRHLETSSGRPVPPDPAFSQALAEAGPLGSHLRSILGILARDAGVVPASLYLAWDFTVISTENLTGPLLHMRDAALAQLQGGVPTFQVTQVRDLGPADPGGDVIARQVIGTFQVPSFLTGPSGDQSDTLNLGPDGLPAQLPGNEENAVFSCLIPRSVYPGPSGPARPGRPVLYGKGLFSIATQMDSLGTRDTAYRYRLVLCSTNWEGLSGNDLATDARLLQDLSSFRILPDHLQQSMVNALYLGRLMSDPRGLDSSPAFRPGGVPLINSFEPLSYYGNSEGSLVGGALTAVSPEWTRAVLGVPSMNYSILLDRSSDFAPLYPLLDRSYPSRQAQQLIFALLQMLWDRGETDGYAEHLVSDPLPGTPVHRVLLQMAFGDHQVSNFATEIEGRTLGASVHRPALPPGLVDGDPFYGMAPAGSDSRAPAVLYVWQDPHVPPPPLANFPPSGPIDPHDFVPRSLPAAQDQLVGFLRTGTVRDVCGGGPCTTSATRGISSTTLAP